MSRFMHRRGNAARAVLIVLAMILSLPAIVIGLALLSYRASTLNAQETLRAERAQAERAQAERAQAERARAVAPTTLNQTRVSPATDASDQSARFAGPGPIGFRPVSETVYATETVEVAVPVFDPETGQTVIRKEQRAVRRPVTTTAWVQQRSAAFHDAQTQQLVNELRRMKTDNPQRGSKMDELRERLNLEFSKMHEAQAKQIQQTEQRLAKVKGIHGQRTENKDQIVQRRMDQLLGEIDPFQWNPIPTSPATTYLPGSQPAPVYTRSHSGTQLVPPSRFEARGGTPVTIPGSVSGTVPGRIGTPVDLQSRPSTAAQLPARQPAARFDADATLPPGFQEGMRQLFAHGNDQPSSVPPLGNDPLNDSRPRRPMEPGVLDASTTVISRLFEISRMSASAKVELAAAEVELAQLKRLEYPGAVSRGQLQSAELKVKQLSGQVALNQIELEAVSDALQRNVELAKAAKDHAKLGLDVIETQYKTGIVKVEKLDSARYELQKAEKQLEAALANVRQLEKAMRIIDGPQTKTEADEEGANTDVAD